MLSSTDPLNERRRFVSRIAAILALALLATACAPALGTYFNPTVAVVNGRKIPESELSRVMRSIVGDPRSPGAFLGRQGIANLRDTERTVVRDLIRNSVVVEAANRLGLTVTESEVSRRLQQFKAQAGSEKAFAAILARERLTLADARKIVREQIVFGKLQQKIGGDATVPDDQIRQYYDENKEGFDQQIHIAHILICENFNEADSTCTPGLGDEDAAKAIAARARAGEDFATLASQNSKDAGSVQKGGDLGWVGQSQGSTFIASAFALQPGEISDPIKTQAGFHVVKQIAKGRPFEEARDEISRQLLQSAQEATFGDFFSGEIRKARIRVNPRYGRFDRNTQTVVAVGSPQRA